MPLPYVIQFVRTNPYCVLQIEVVPLNEKGKEITEEDDIFIDNPNEMV